MVEYVEVSRITGINWKIEQNQYDVLDLAEKMITGVDYPAVIVEQIGVDPKMGAIYELLDQSGLIVCHAARLLRRDVVRAEIRNVNQFSRKA